MRNFFLLAATIILLSSCNIFGGRRVSGNGRIVSEQRQVSAFNSIEASGSLKVHLRQDSATSVKVETDENLMPYLEVYVTNNVLIIKSKDNTNLNPSKDLIVYATAPMFKDISVSGSGDIISDNIVGGAEPLDMSVSGSGTINAQVALPKVSTNVSGSGNVILKGMAKEFNGSISGSGSIKAFDLTTDITSLELSGAADAEVTANQTLNVNVSGSGDVKYKGEAAVTQNISGSGSVKKVPLSP